MKNFTQGFAKSILLVAMSSVVFTSCGNTDVASQVTTPAAVGGSNNGGASGGTSNYQPDAQNNYSDMLPAEQAPDQPLDTPEPLPAPQTPAEPGEIFAVKAVGNTTAFAVPKLSKYIQLNGVYVYIHLTWQPVKGASEYWIYKNTIPAWNEVRRENATAIVEAKDSQGFITGSLTGYKDGLSAPNLKDGGLWDRIKRGFQTITLRPNVDYTYKVVAVDVNGIPMSESDITTGSAMGAVRSPQMYKNDNRVVGTVTPNLGWTTPNTGNALAPDGYYVTLFPSVQGITSGVLPSTSLAAWGTYAKHNNKAHQVTYGKSKSNLLSYVGVLPFDITFDLKPGAKYSWSVVSVRTNTYDMKNATQISRSWGGFGHFQVAANARPANSNTEADIVSQNLRNQRVSAQRAPQQRAPYPVYNGQSVPQQQQYPNQQQSYGPQYQQQQYPNQYGGSQYPQQTGYPQQEQRKYY